MAIATQDEGSKVIPKCIGFGSWKNDALDTEEKYKGNFIQLHTPNLEISSQTLRDWIRQGKSVRYYLVDEVYTYIREEGIYRA